MEPRCRPLALAGLAVPLIGWGIHVWPREQHPQQGLTVVLRSGDGGADRVMTVMSPTTTPVVPAVRQALALYAFDECTVSFGGSSVDNATTFTQLNIEDDAVLIVSHQC